MAEATIAFGFELGIATDRGRKRQQYPNQDAVELMLPGPGEHFLPLLVLADGMGGHTGGALASKLVLDGFRETIRTARFPTDCQEVLEICTQEAHRLVKERGSQAAELGSMGSTVVAALLEAERVHIVNVGDSRAYLQQGKALTLLSFDHSWVGEHVRAGLLTQAEALKHPQRNRLTLAISANRSEIQPYLSSTPLGKDDAVILCSDGLWGVVPETLIWAAVNELDPQAAAEKLISLANSSQGPDNISVIIARRHQPGRERPAKDLDDTNPG